MARVLVRCEARRETSHTRPRDHIHAVDDSAFRRTVLRVAGVRLSLDDLIHGQFGLVLTEGFLAAELGSCLSEAHDVEMLE